MDLSEQLAEAKADADRGWADAEERQNDATVWAQTARGFHEAWQAAEKRAEQLQYDLTRTENARVAWKQRAEEASATIACVKELADDLDELAGPDLDWSVRAKDAAAKIRAALNGAVDQSDQTKAEAGDDHV